MRRIERISRTCACGCGNTFLCRTLDVKKFLKHHQNIGSKRSAETIKKLSEGKIGNKNPMKRPDVKAKAAISFFKKGQPAWNKGLPWGDETRKKLSIINKGRTPSEETREKLSLSHRRERHWNWMGGKSLEGYAPTFNSQLKDRIRVRDNFACQLCATPEIEFDRKLDIHHIDYNKGNSDQHNLITLCQSCHVLTNMHRDSWKNFFVDMQMRRGIGPLAVSP